MQLLCEDPQYFADVPSDLKAQFSDLILVDEKKSAEMGSDYDFHKSLLVSESLTPQKVVESVIRGNHQVMQKGSIEFWPDMKCALSFIKNPKSFFAEKQEGLIISDAKNPVEFGFSSPNDKEELLQSIEKYVGKVGHQSFHEALRAVTEEMYMNAVFDAPKEALKKGWKEKPYLEGQKARLRLSRSEDRLLITCIDPYGSLDGLRFLGRMQEVYLRGAGEVINLKPGSGAGLGCVIMFEHSVQMAFGVVPNKSTVFSCVIPLHMSYRQRTSHKKNLHLIRI